MNQQEILEAHRDLMALLARAAGVEGKQIRSITCRCEHRQWPEFTVELLGDEDDIRTAIDKQEKVQS